MKRTLIMLLLVIITGISTSLLQVEANNCTTITNWDYTGWVDNYSISNSHEGSDTFCITDVADLKGLAAYVNQAGDTDGIQFLQTTDIDLTNESNWTPIGNYSVEGAWFYGTYNGNGKTVSNLKITSVDQASNVGLFGIVDIGGEVKDLTLTNITISLNGDNDNVGSVTGQLYGSDSYGFGKITNVNVTGDISVSTTDGSNLGGLVGYNYGGIITNSSINADGDNSITITAGGGSAGTLVGKNEGGTIQNSFITTETTTEINIVDSNVAGGFVGWNTGTISNSYITSSSGISITGDDHLGGYVGYNVGTVEEFYLAVKNLTISDTGSNIGKVYGSGSGTIQNGFYAEDTELENLEASDGIYLYKAKSNWYEYDEGFALYGYISTSSDIIDDFMNESDQLSTTDSDYTNLGGSESTIYAPLLYSYSSDPKSLLDSQILFDLNTFEYVTSSSSSTSQEESDASNLSSTSYSIKSIPLEETHHIELDTDGITTEIGYHIDLPAFTGYKLYGYYETDLTDQVEITGTYDVDKVGVYKILYTLTAYNERNEEYDTVMETFTLNVVDTTSPIITGDETVDLFINQDLPILIEVSDNSNGDITVTQDKEIDNTLYGDQMITYTAVDKSGNSNSFTQTISFRYPEVKQEIITIDNQSFVFVLNEKDNDLENPIIEYAIVKDNVTEDTQWTETPLVPKEGEKVVVRLLSNTGSVLSTRETNVKPVTSIVENTNDNTPSELDTEAVIEPIEQSSNNTELIIGILGGFIAITAGWWFLLGKRRKDDDEQETK